MSGTMDIFNNEDYNSVWDRVLASDTGQIDPNDSLILTLMLGQQIVSVKHIGPNSTELTTALNQSIQDQTGVHHFVNLNGYQYIESEQSFEVGERSRMRFGILSYNSSKDKDYYVSMLNWMNERQSKNVLTIVTLEQVMEEADYQFNYKALLQALQTCVQKSGVDIQLALLDSYDAGFKHRQGWEASFVLDVQSAEAKIMSLLDTNHLYEGLICEGSLFNEACTEHLVIPIVKDKQIVSCLTASVESTSRQILIDLKSKVKWLQKLFLKGYETEIELNEAKKRDLLLEVTKKFHSTMDISEVLDKIVYAINETYPTFDVHLMLSHEWEVNEELPIKPLLYGSEGMDAKVEQAFLTGMKQVDRDQQKDHTHLFVPLRGKQGIYGVLEVRANELDVLPDEEISFIEILADTGGSALENAELYKQSRDLIHDLKLINKATHQINMNLNLNDLIESMTLQIQEAFGAEEVGFLLFDRNDHTVIHQSGTAFFQLPENIDKFDSLITQLLTKKDSIYIGDTNLHSDVDSGLFRSMLTIPMLQKQSVHGAVFVLHQDPYHFTFESFKLLQSLVHHSTLAFTNTLLHEELEKLVITDHLTNLHSRNHLEACMDQSILEHEHGTFLLIDIDNFKRINDTYGHQIGDEIIVQVANVIRRNIRETDIAARWGGEELAVYLPKVDLNIGTEIAKRIVKAVALETNPNVTISCGVSFWSNNHVESISSGSLFKSADARLYKAKSEGKNRVVLID